MPAPDVLDSLPAAGPLAALTDKALEEELASFAASIAAVEAQFLDHVVELDVRGLWARQGARSAAHWLSWRLGLRLNAARERVRVAHALLHLPAISASFHRGELSYCKVRALTRVATPASEDQLLEIALGATGAQLERVTRAWRGVRDPVAQPAPAHGGRRIGRLHAPRPAGRRGRRRRRSGPGQIDRPGRARQASGGTGGDRASRGARQRHAVAARR